MLLMLASICAVIAVAIYIEVRHAKRVRALEAQAALERRRSWDRQWKRRRAYEATGA